MNETQWLLGNRLVLAIVLPLLLLMAWTAKVAIDAGEPVVVALLGPAVLLVVAAIHQRSRIDGHDMRVSIVPLWRRRIPLHTIAEAETTRYRPIRDFGGWGIRFGIGAFRGTVAYSIAGDEGLLLRLKDGKRVMVGTRHPRDWQVALQAKGVATMDART